jgi:iron complex outermembrane receptor protein
MPSRSSIYRFVSTLSLLSVPFYLSAQEDEPGSVFNLDPFVVSTDNVGYQARNSLSATKFDIQVRDVPITVTSLTGEYLQDTYSQNLSDAIRFTAGITTGSSVNAEEEDGFYIRGLETLRSKRNGIVHLYTQDMTNVSKVEVVKGPMSLLYGQVEPGGIINYLTLNALDEFRTDLKFTIGDYDHYRAQINHTGPILKGNKEGKGRLLYRVDASYKSDGGWRDNTEDERTFLSGLLEFKPFSTTTIEVQWDYLNQNSYNVSSLPAMNKQWRSIWEDLLESTDPSDYSALIGIAGEDPYTSYSFDKQVIFSPILNKDITIFSIDSSEPRFWDGYAEHWDWEFNQVPLNAFNDIDINTASIEIRQHLGESWFAKFFMVYNQIDRESIWGQVIPLGISGENSDGYFSNHWDRYNEDYSYQLEVTGKWDLFGIENQSILGLEYLENRFEAFLADDSRTNLFRPQIISEIDRLGASNPYFNTNGTYVNIAEYVFPLSKPLTPRRDEEKETKAAFFSNIARLFDSKLLLLFGLRYDEILIEEFEEDQSDGSRVHRRPPTEDSSVSPQLGMSYSLNDQLTLYASYSESFVPQAGGTPILKGEDERPSPSDTIPVTAAEMTDEIPKTPILGEGYEFGGKFSFMEDKVSGSVAYFHTELTGVERRFTVPVPGYIAAGGKPFTTQLGSQDNGREIDGFETELFLRPSDGWQVVLTYAYIESIELVTAEIADIREGNAISLSIPSISVPRNQAGMWTKYSFKDGPLDGLSVGGGFSWMDKRFAEYELLSENQGLNSGVFVVSDNERVEKKILLEDQITFEILFSYDFSAADIDYTFQLNIKNLFDERFVLPGGMPNEPRRVYATLQAKF